MGNYTLYKLYKLQRKPKGDTGATWQDVVPSVYSYDGDGTKNPVVVEENSTQCGYTPPIEPQYRWINMDSSIDYYCQGTTKYYKQKKQVSMDSGSTWTDMSPMEYRMGASAETNSVDCGGGIEPQYKWVNITPTTASSSYWCDDCPPTGYTAQYLTFVAQENGTFRFSGDSISYSLDSGSTWATLASNTDSPMVTIGNSIMWKNDKEYGNIGTFSSSNNFYAEGNPMSLLYGDDFSTHTSLNDKTNAFKNLFKGCTTITSAENLMLVATELSSSCYQSMFQGCVNLVIPPSIIGNENTIMTPSACTYMYSGCTSMTTASELPAKAMSTMCYASMFSDCTSMTTAPSSVGTSASTMQRESCVFMFRGCTSLTTAPELLAKSINTACYAYMFRDCTSMTTAPSILPATELPDGCYQGMFLNCTSLTNPPILVATNPTGYLCYGNMFRGCSSLIEAPSLMVDTIDSTICENMFRDCSSLKRVTCLAANNYPYVKNWLMGVSANGTFTKNPNTSWYRSVNEVPSNWTIVDYSS